MSTHTVGELARLAGISVRTLHHYDEVGLLVPNERSPAGYRLYDPNDVAMLQQILFYRELGLSLDEIQQIISDPSFNRARALKQQREELAARIDHLEQMIAVIDATLDADERGTKMNPSQMLDVFGDFDPSAHQAEVQERWGHTDAYRESTRRTLQYTTADWERLTAETTEINLAFLDLMRTGIASDETPAMEIAERHRAHISEWFYECSPEIHAGLGEMYVTDPRFAENIDKAGAGLAAYMADAIRANRQRLLD